MNWMRFGWGSEFSQTFDPAIPFHIDISNLIKSNKSLLEISTRVIKRIIEKYPPPYHLMLSGGMDSQIMLWCWLNSSIPFHPVSVKYVGAPEYKEVLNDHDLVELEQFANNHNVQIDYKYFDIINFLENNLENYAIKYQCTSPQLCTHMCMSEQLIEGTIIFSGNFAIDFGYNYTILGLKRYAETSGRSIIPFFLLHDPELAGLVKYVSGKEKKYSIKKCEEYTNLGAPVIPQPKKQTGFEVIKDYYDTRKDLIVSPKIRIKYANMPSKRKFDLLFRYMLMEKIKYVDKVVYIRPNSQ
jgi:hypothetical protein